MMNGRGKSDRSTVPRKPPNKAGRPAAEAVEGKDLAKGNSPEGNAFRTQRRGDARSALERVRQAARRDRKLRFTALFHHVYDIDRLRTAYFALKRDASAGVDGETWRHYGEALEGNLADLADRLKRGAYRAKPVRRVHIPKPDGRQRPIGVTTLEDKVVQRAVVEVLNAIYEQDFVPFSYGFRPGRSQHQALDALAVGLERRRVNWVLDADIRGFFDSVDHAWLVKFVEHRIGDVRVVRLIQKWLSAGVQEAGTWTPSETGTAQGGSISPLLANLYLHYVFDVWYRRWATNNRGDVIAMRFADDTIVGFQHREDAERFLTELPDRFATFGLELHPDKTRIVPFGPRVWAGWRVGRGQKPGTFDFLGFTHISGASRRGRFLLQRKTVRKRRQAKLREVATELRIRMHDSVPAQGAYLRSVIDGHFRYYGVPGNGGQLEAFRHRVIWFWRKTLRRRSQTHRMTWKRVYRYVARWIPSVRIHHPWPNQRYDVKT
jgi:group II intron reverse transcriptase/maturase